jgi:hypothetical protein
LGRQMFRYGVVANLSSSSHFNLERQPGLADALSGACESVKWLSLYQIAEIAFQHGIDTAGEYLYNELKVCNIALIHKEIVEFIPIRVLRRLSSEGVLTTGFLGDEEWALQFTANFVPIFDITVVYTQIALIEYSQFGRKLLKLPVGGSFKALNHVEVHSEDIDVLFIGRPYSPRPDIINYLISNGVKVEVYGSEKWKEHIPKEFYHGFLDNSIYNQTLSRAKIVLGLMEAPDDGPPHINAKIFDACKNTKFAICTYYAPFYSDYGLEEGVSIVTYRSQEELLEKVQYYLHHSEKRKGIASAMKAIIAKNFDYSVLYRKLLNSVESYYLNEGRILSPTEKKIISRVDLESIGWSFLKPCSKVVFDPLTADVCVVNSSVGELIVVNSIYRGRLIKKRLPIVDANSVLLRNGAEQPFSLFGLSWCPARTKVPYFALNTYQNNCIAMDVMAILDFCVDWILEKVRGRHKV